MNRSGTIDPHFQPSRLQTAPLPSRSVPASPNDLSIHNLSLSDPACSPHSQNRYVPSPSLNPADAYQSSPYAVRPPDVNYNSPRSMHDYTASPTEAAVPQPPYMNPQHEVYATDAYQNPNIAPPPNGYYQQPPPVQAPSQQFGYFGPPENFRPQHPSYNNCATPMQHYYSPSLPPPSPSLSQRSPCSPHFPHPERSQSVNDAMSSPSDSAPISGATRKSTNRFPPVTMENISKFRNQAKASNDPRQLLDLAKYLMEAVAQIRTDEKDSKRTRQVKEAMMIEAQKITKKLASQGGPGKSGYADAQFYLANCYGNGAMGLQVDHEKAFSLYVQGSKQNHAGCTYRAAVCSEVGAGTRRDTTHAMQFFRKAANLGDPAAMYKLGMVLLKGFLGQPRNPREGLSWLKRASQFADEDNPHALHELGLAYETEGIPSVIPDVNYARELFTKAAQLGYAPSQFKLGLAYENGFLNCQVNARRSIAWYSKAAQQGDLESELALSGWYLTGAEGVLAQNDAEAYLWARKSADKGFSKAEYAVGYYTETGIGTKQNLDEAKKWYMRAAAQNNRRAMQRLTELKKYGSSAQHRQRHTRGANGAPSSKDSDCVIM
ncbi:hypothetical protein DFQ28_005684 [Apophysomyces sp. BC1034]|nr:hypothetical protein DFQ30_006301 [Apophysomyces sp. BC1015]KAG0177038.1 hypothetical protein DFQ29_005321 [Apophysomyces sp. BC1021]KAG0187912.1 hypothetical protein DFQ28_005684 [Apophysomyces sp. BC1034]